MPLSPSAMKLDAVALDAMDPVFGWLARIGLALLFGAAALHKIRNLEEFSATVRDYRILPAGLAVSAATGLAVCEASTALALIFPVSTALGPAASLALLMLYSGVIGLNLARGRRHIDCGCMGPGRGQTISGWLIARNLGLAAPAILLLGPVAPRALGWVDLLSVAAGVGMTALLWLGAHQLARSRALSLPSGVTP